MPLKNLLHTSFLVTLKCHKHGHMHIGNMRESRGGRESGTPWKKTSSIGFNSKMQFGPITLEKVGPPCDPPPPLSGLFKNYSFFE